MPNLPLRTAIVTGAASGLGREFAFLLAKRGWSLTVADIDMVGLEETCDAVHSAGGNVRSVRLDVTDAEQWRTLLDQLRQEWPQLDLLVNNAGVSYSGPFETMPIADWQKVLAVNLDGTMFGCRTMAPWLIENSQGAHIINVASFAAVVQGPYMAPYNVSKSAVVALSESLYTEFVPHGVNVTVACPWFFDSGLLDNGRISADWLKNIAKHFVETSRFTATDVAQETLRAMEKKQLYAFVTRRGWRFWRMKRLAPQAFLNLVRRQFARLRKRWEEGQSP